MQDEAIQTAFIDPGEHPGAPDRATYLPQTAEQVQRVEHMLTKTAKILHVSLLQVKGPNMRKTVQ